MVQPHRSGVLSGSGVTGFPMGKLLEHSRAGDYGWPLRLRYSCRSRPGISQKMNAEVRAEIMTIRSVVLCLVKSANLEPRNELRVRRHQRQIEQWLNELRELQLRDDFPLCSQIVE